MRPLLASLAIALLIGPASAQEAPPTGDWSDYVPTTELYTGTESPPETGLVERLFRLAFTEPCNGAIDGGYGGTTPDIYDLTYRPYWDEPDDPARAYRLYRFTCNGGAYNFSSVFYGWNEIDGLQPLSFAVPETRMYYAEEDTLDERPIRMQFTGMVARYLMTNVEVDAEAGTIYSVGYWRGLGDASSRGTWVFANGEWVLSTYDIDGSYDGEINPVRVVDYSQPADVPMIEMDIAVDWVEDKPEDDAE